MSKRITLFFYCVTALSLFFVMNAQGDLAIWANNGEDKVLQDELRATLSPAAVVNSAWDGTKVKVFGAKNEITAFALILEAGGAAAGNIGVSFTALTGPGGATIASKAVSGDGVFDWTGRNIELFYVRYLQIRNLSRYYYRYNQDERHIPERMQRPWSGEGVALPGTIWEDRPGADKYFPEILVPLELVAGNVFNIAQDRNQAIWVDIYIPKTATAGLYTGSVAVSQNGAVIRQIPVELKVYDFSLPDVPRLKTLANLSGSNINKRYNNGAAVVDRHFQFFHRHKIDLVYAAGASANEPSAEWLPRLNGALFSIANQYDGPGRDQGLNVFSIGTYGAWGFVDPWTESSLQAYADGWVNWFTSHSPQTEYFLYVSDEPSNDRLVRTEQFAGWIKNGSGPGRNLLTLSTLGVAKAPFAPSVSIPSCHPSMRVTAPVWAAFHEAYRSDPANPAKNTRLQYYNGMRPQTGSFATEDDGTALRALAWIQYKFRIDHWFYWNVNFWTDDQFGGGDTNVFRNATTTGYGGTKDPLYGYINGTTANNGDGVLIYPGTDRIYPAESYNVNGPIGGVRLKAWRRGIQDGDYLALAAQVDAGVVDQLVQETVQKALFEVEYNNPNEPTWGAKGPLGWSNNPDLWEAARAELADIIETGNVNRVHISGAVTYDGSGVAGALLDGLPGNPVTNASGQYNVSVAMGWSGTVIPAKPGYSFAPGRRDYVNVTAEQTAQNYAAGVTPYAISGTITYNGSGLAGAVLTGLPGNPVTDASGQYTALVHSGWSGTARPILAGYTFTPATRSYAVNQTANQTVQDFAASASSSPESGSSGTGGGGGGGG
ncbi:MAG: DUF4091 domain-containing protein, partial [Planctomycetaceae bacterium]